MNCRASENYQKNTEKLTIWFQSNFETFQSFRSITKCGRNKIRIGKKPSCPGKQLKIRMQILRSLDGLRNDLEQILNIGNMFTPESHQLAKKTATCGTDDFTKSPTPEKSASHHATRPRGILCRLANISGKSKSSQKKSGTACPPQLIQSISGCGRV